MEHYPELQRFIMGKSEDSNLVSMVRPGIPNRLMIFTSTVYLSEEDANYLVLRFGATLRLKNET